MVCGKLLVNFEFTHNRMLKAHIDLQYLNNYIYYYYYNIKYVIILTFSGFIQSFKLFIVSIKSFLEKSISKTAASSDGYNK